MTTSAFPVLYDHCQLVPGDGFVAAIKLSGRTLLREEDGEVSFAAVQPPGFAGCGETRAEAWASFMEELRVVLVDLAEDASSFDHFRASVERFFHGPNGSLERLWREAVEAVKSGATEVTWARKLESYPEREVEILRLGAEGELAALGLGVAA